MKKLVLAAVLIALSEAALAQETITVYKDPNCGYCKGWVSYLEKSGFNVVAHDTADLANIKAKYGVPGNLMSCHTALIHGYVLEGHVPVQAINKLLKEKPAVKGLAVPGMPMDAPGMGTMDGKLKTVDFSGKLFSVN